MELQTGTHFLCGMFFWLAALPLACSNSSLYNCTLPGVSYVYKTSLTNYENLGQTEGKKQRYKEGKKDEARYRVAPQLKI